MKYRVIIKDNRYIPQVYDSKENTWNGFVYSNSEDIMKYNTSIIGFDTQSEVEAFVYAEMNRQDPDHQYVWKTYES
jgi:hypothetical protein